MFTLDRDLRKHAREFLSALKTLKFEKTEDGGIYFPKQRAFARGMYTHDVNGLDVRCDPNLLPTEGLTHMLAVDLGATAKTSAWYLAMYATAISPAAGWTAASFTATAGEITSGTEGYTSATRVAFTAGTAAAASIDNNASKAAFTIITASTLTANGIGMLSDSAKGSTSGVLKSASRFATARVFNTADVFNVGYAVALTSS